MTVFTLSNPASGLQFVRRSLELEKEQLRQRVASLAAGHSGHGSGAAPEGGAMRQENMVRMLRQEVDALRQQLEVCISSLSCCCLFGASRKCQGLSYPCPSGMCGSATLL